MFLRRGIGDARRVARVTAHQHRAAPLADKS